MSDEKDVAPRAESELRQYARMTYAEDQACNLPKIERASVRKSSTTTAPKERIVHG